MLSSHTDNSKFGYVNGAPKFLQGQKSDVLEFMPRFLALASMKLT